MYSTYIYVYLYLYCMYEPDRYYIFGGDTVTDIRKYNSLITNICIYEDYYYYILKCRDFKAVVCSVSNRYHVEKWFSQK